MFEIVAVIDQEKGGFYMEDKKYVNFGCILQGNKKHLKKIKEHIIQEYVKLGLVKLSKPIYDKNGIYILTGEEWEEYQTLKKYKEEGLIGGWP